MNDEISPISKLAGNGSRCLAGLPEDVYFSNGITSCNAAGEWYRIPLKKVEPNKKLENNL
jgi:hypothetical protein